MKILFVRWGTFNEEMLFENLKRAGNEVIQFYGKPVDYNVDKEFLLHIFQKIEESGCEAMISFDFFPLLADACALRGILYISWVFDCPHSTLFCKSVFHETNRIFIFDRAFCDELKTYGIENVYHLPLATDTDLFSYIIEQKSEEREQYATDISFMGGMYTGEYNFFDQIKFLPDEIKGYLDGLIASQEKIYGYNFIRELLTDEMVKKIKEYIKFDFGEQYFIPDRNVITNMLNKKVTVQERQEVVSALSSLYAFDLYTGSSTEKLPHANNRGFVSYTEIMPLVFHCSRINLNISLKSISSGIPLRALDIMACGGFLLSNYQTELAENFADGEELVLYTDINDLKNKTAYYLEHEEERVKIAKAGKKKVHEDFNYQTQLKKMFELL